VEKVAEVGVVGALDWVSYSTGPGLPIIGGSYAFMVLSDKRALALAPLSLAMARGGGRRRTSGDWATLMLDMVEVMLEADRFLLCPLLYPPVLPSVFARERFPGGLTRSVRIWRWNLVPVAASDSEGMSSLTWTV
jgi:hypothetical protein